jgi:ATP-dependent Lhr-like helicase
MEARGEIRGGRFVGGFLGEQFARPEAVDLLRAMRREGTAAAGTAGIADIADIATRVAASDPLNLVGILLPGPRVSPLSGQIVELVPAWSTSAAS